MGWNFDTQSRSTQSRGPHFGGLYSCGPNLPNHHKRKSRPSSRPGPGPRSQKTDAQTHGRHRRHHHKLRHRSLPSRRRFRGHNQRSIKRPRPSPTRPRISVSSSASDRGAQHPDVIEFTHTDDLVVATSCVYVIFHPREPQSISVGISNINALISFYQCSSVVSFTF